ncbi:capsule biosynthesis protein [Plastoroseomonas arctica]|uniref:Capsule biosynthesis protein n=1 Tax=Plastoroseomonas arctica TaxID=1509237 RepID=A0AAF1JXI6_9PROT|nr:capsule biosynthesis protein [Plastoroseomonas arctica]MBR0654368.1 capsule biosynthesis protein [Plastoroseomonas arctica]
MTISMKLSPHTTLSDPQTSEQLGWPGEEDERPPSWLDRLRAPFLWLVVLPTLIVGGYLYGIAADQYVSEARFIVRGSAQSAGGGPVAAAIGGIGGGAAAAGASSGGAEAMALRDYVNSFDAIRDANEILDIAAIYQREEADWWFRLDRNVPELMTRYVNNMVTVSRDSETGTGILRVRAFRPEDAHNYAETLMTLAERLINRLSERQRNDTLNNGRREVAIAEARVLAARDAISEFREREQNLDATRSAAAAGERITALQAQLTLVRTEAQNARNFLRVDNPQYIILQNRIRAIEAQIAEDRQASTRGGDALLQQVSAFERLVLEREFADKQLSSATTSLEGARYETQRQQLYLARVVQPSLPVYPLYPRRMLIVLSVFGCLCIIYAVGRLIASGLRENAS